VAVFDVAVWRKLAEAAAADPETLVEVDLAAGDPAAYLNQFAWRLAERGIEQVDDVDPLIALVDGLMDRGRLAEFDWKEGDESVLATLNQLEPVRAVGAVFPPAELAGVEEALPYAAEILADYGQSVVGIDIGSDSYPTLVLPSDRVAGFRAAAEAADVTIKVWGPVGNIERTVSVKLTWDEDDEELRITVAEWEELSRIITRLERSGPDARLEIRADPPVAGIRCLHVTVEGGRRDAFGEWSGKPTHVTVAELDDPARIDQVHRTSSSALRYQIIKRFVAGQPVDLEEWEPRWGEAA
jgi:hypothetical protein